MYNATISATALKPEKADYTRPEVAMIVKGKLLETFSTWPKIYSISFELKPVLFEPRYHSILHAMSGVDYK